MDVKVLVGFLIVLVLALSTAKKGRHLNIDYEELVAKL